MDVEKTIAEIEQLERIYSLPDTRSPQPKRDCLGTHRIRPFKVVHTQVNAVLVATDFSPASGRPLCRAITIARNYGAKLYLLHVVSSIGFTLAGPSAVATAETLALRHAEQLEHNLVASGALQRVCHQAIVCDGDICVALEKVIGEEHIDLVVIGAHSRMGLSKFIFGSVAERILRSTSAPVLTVGPKAPPEMERPRPGAPRPLLFATDFSEASLRVLPYAISLANERIAKLVLVHVLPSAPRPKGNGWYMPDDISRVQKEAQVSVRRRLEALTSDAGLSVEPEFITEVGEPAKQILRIAEDLAAQVIVLGLPRRNHAAVISHLPWSTAYQVVCWAPCAVLTVKN
jgi:nucleotide-binding universal stress UspA family protein